ncbi:AMIN domain-containing protein [Sulfurimonas sp. HSL3-2]|uniref:AMIN domain-containing protein n=1 Tax=Hydrocurvibacter mobilis TaxID=3131936 RepID=UPI0031F86641
MFKSIVLLISLILSLNARENPFFPTQDSQNLSISTNKVKQHDPLKRATITLPSSARIVREVSVEYINLDGSIEKKSISLDNSIDWHLPIFISQSYTNDTAEKEHPILKEQSTVKKEQEFKKIADYEFISFAVSGKKLKIMTKDKKIRSFMLLDPYRIVVDFKRDADFRSYQKKFKRSIYKNVRIGNHKGYYRVVIELDGQYKYDLKKDDNSYILDCY